MEDKAKILKWNFIINGREKTRVDEIDKKVKMTFEWSGMNGRYLHTSYPPTIPLQG